VTASGCAIYVNSSSSGAVTVIGGASVTASAIDVVGGAVVNNGGIYDPGPGHRSGGSRRPLRLIAGASSGQLHLHPNQTSPATNAVLSPGTYCGGIYVGNGATNVTFNSGIYIIDGGGLSFNGSGEHCPG
jgi:hypothetical protein